MSSPTVSARFEERLWPGPLGWTAAVAFAVVLGVALVPVDLGLAFAVGLVALVVVLAALVVWTPTVRVTADELHAGQAHIPLDLLDGPHTLAGDELRAQLGPSLDARAYLCLRGWVHTAVRVRVTDPHDPTPYWIVSTRDPDGLVAALTRG